jgi:hypothetical protein
MKNRLILTAFTMLLAVPAFAADNSSQPKGPGPNFEQHRAEILKRIDGRIARNQEEKSCVQAAKNHDDIKACRDKFKEELKEQRQKRP